MNGQKWKALPGLKTARAAGCLAAALVACALLLSAHRQAGSFSVSAAVMARGERHGSQTAVPWPSGMVDVNTASVEELESLTAVGPKLAEAIIAEREAGGLFDYPEDLVMVRGIGAKTLARFYSQLYFPARSAVP